MSEVILALDVGTSGVKASFIDSSLQVIAAETVGYKSHYALGGIAEQDPEDWWTASRQACALAIQDCPEVAAQVSAIGISAHMMALLAVDAQGTPLTACMTHTDTRAHAEMEAIFAALGEEEVYRITGNVLNPAAPLCKALWLKNNSPEIYNRTAYFLNVKDYIVFRLTGGVFSSDYSDASHSQYLDCENNVYAEDMFHDLGLDPRKLPPLHKSHDIVGTLSAQAAADLGLKCGIPVCAGGGDGACANVGAGLTHPGDVYCNLGTTAWISYNSPKYYMDKKRRLINIASLDGVSYGVFGTMEAAGKALEWSKDLLGIENMQRFDELVATVPACSDGLIFLPYLVGERSPIFDAMARGVYFGAGLTHKKEHFARATMEGVALALSSIIDAMEELAPDSPLRMIGGGAKSQIWKQVIADTCQREIITLAMPASAATSIGAAVAAGVGVGVFSSYDEAAAKIKVKDISNCNKDLAEAYALSRRKFNDIYPAIKDIYRYN